MNPCRISESSPAVAPDDARNHLQHLLLAPGDAPLSDAQALALLCGLAEPDASRLLDHFGSLPEVLGAPGPDLAREAGKRAAVQIRLVQLLARRQLACPLRTRDVITSSGQLHAYLRATLTGLPREQFRVLFLDRRNRLIADEVMSEGTIDHAPVFPREVMRRALERHAAAIVLVHNHPSGDPSPSTADVDMTRQVAEAARALRLSLHDHKLIAGSKAISFRALGLL